MKVTLKIYHPSSILPGSESALVPVRWRLCLNSHYRHVLDNAQLLIRKRMSRKQPGNARVSRSGRIPVRYPIDSRSHTAHIYAVVGYISRLGKTPGCTGQSHSHKQKHFCCAPGKMWNPSTLVIEFDNGRPFASRHQIDSAARIS